MRKKMRRKIRAVFLGGLMALGLFVLLFPVNAFSPSDDGFYGGALADNASPGITDYYGILKMPHRYAVKLVKFEGATGRLETYEFKEGDYLYRHSYLVHYRKEGPKSAYGDLKTVGGPVVRYLYRTTRSSMVGYDKEGGFGVYKVSYPMPYDAFPYLLNGKMSRAQYEKIPAISRSGDILVPHPHSMLGADIVIHTEKYGSLGCIIMDHSDMARLYREDLVTENDREIIPFVVYDENVKAPEKGHLF